MSAFERFVTRPVLASVVGLVVLLLGLQGIISLTVREYPETTTSTIVINTPYIGANAELVRGFITTPLESAIATAEGIDYLQSTSTQGNSTITARLELGYDPNDAVAEILTKIQQVRNQLPEESEDSIVYISRGEGGASMYLAFSSEVLARNEITDYLNRAVRPRLETVTGVQQARVLGEQTIAMRVFLNPRRLAALGVTPAEVRAAIANSNFLAAVGSTKGSTLSVSLDASTSLDSVEAFRDLIVRQEGDAIIRLRDVAEVTLGAENYDTSVLFDGEPAVFMAVEVAPTANLLSTITAVREILPDIGDQLPASLNATVVYDATVAVEDSINEVVSSLVEALIIVTLVIFLFLGSLRSALVPGIAMPLAIVGAFFLMQMMGFSINLLTLLALILAIGTVVDDGIVIVENAARHIEEGADPEEAARRTIRELSGSIVAMNIVVLAVFAPIGLMGGLTGALFTEFAYTVAGATLISGIIALTLSPMMCARLLKRTSTEKKGPARWVDTGFQKLSKGYSRALSAALDARWLVMGAGLIVLASVPFLYTSAENELAPQEDNGFLLVSAEGDPNISIDQLERWTAQMAEAIRRTAPVEHVFVINGTSGGGPGGDVGNSAFGGVPLKDWDERDRTQQEIEGPLQGAVAQVPGLQTVVISPPALPGGGEGTPVQMVVSSIEDPLAVYEVSEELVRAAERSGRFAFVRSDLQFDRVQQRIVIDRERASALGIDIAQLGQDLSTLLSGGYVNFFTLEGRSYRVVPQAQRQFRLRPEQLKDFYVRSQSGALVPLGNLVTLEPTVQPRSLSRFNQLNSAIISGVPAPGVALGQAVEFLEQQADNILPNGYVVDWAGRSRQFVEESSALILSFGLAITLMYLTLSAQYGSFRDPAVMFVSVPMSLAGALAFFAAGVVTVNIYTQIGLLALIASIIRHGILLVEFANDIQRSEGLERRPAMEKAASLRLRAILMTTIATLVGLVPLLLASSGPGAASRFAISFTLGIGMALGTIFTIFVVPAVYTLVASRHHREAEEREPQAERELAAQPAE